MSADHRRVEIESLDRDIWMIGRIMALTVVTLLNTVAILWLAVTR